MILKDGRIAQYSDLAQERASNRRFLEMELRGDRSQFAEAAHKIGCEYALAGTQRLKLVLPEGVEVKDLYALAAAQEIQIRRLTYKRDSLEDIFLKAME